MCEMQKLRVSVEQILIAAAEEIFGVFQRSIEENVSESSKLKKRNQRPPAAVHQTEHLGRSPPVDQEEPGPPHIKEEQEEEHTMKLTKLSECPTLNQKLWMVREEPPLEQQDRSPSLDQVDPEPPRTKEEEDLWTNQKGEQLQGLQEAHIAQFPFAVKREYDGDEAQSSQLHQSRAEENAEEPEHGYGGSEPDSIQNNDVHIRAVACQTLHQCTADAKTCTFPSASETQTTDDATKKPFSCSFCKKRFTRKSDFKRHIAVHTGVKPFSCSFCKKRYARKSDFKRHMSVHTGEKPFSCAVCKKGFTQKCHLKNHLPIHAEQKPFSCSVCKKGFAQKGNLHYHMSVRTGERPFSCSVCRKSFVSKSKLKSHTSVHTGEKPFRCSVCNKGFTQKRYLNTHMSVHTGEKALSCSVCKRGFVSRGKLKEHMSAHTAEKLLSCSVFLERLYQ